MSETKTIPEAVERPRTFTVVQSQAGGVSLRVELQREIDRLALLIEEVKRQGDKVVAVADAIGDRMLAENFQINAPKSRRSEFPSLVKPEARKKNGAPSASKSSNPLPTR